MSDVYLRTDRCNQTCQQIFFNDLCISGFIYLQNHVSICSLESSSVFICVNNVIYTEIKIDEIHLLSYVGKGCWTINFHSLFEYDILWGFVVESFMSLLLQKKVYNCWSVYYCLLSLTFLVYLLFFTRISSVCFYLT